MSRVRPFIRSFSHSPFMPSASFVPRHTPASDLAVEELSAFLAPSEHLLVLTGAGISTESGIPDYRSEGVGLYARTDKRPIQHKVFMESHKGKRK